jgi:hypothetical protein
MGSTVITLWQRIIPAEKNEFINFDEQVDDLLDTIHPEVVSDIYGVHSTEVLKVDPDFDLLCCLFGWVPADSIKRTFAVMTRYACGRVSDTIKQHWQPVLHWAGNHQSRY